MVNSQALQHFDSISNSTHQQILMDWQGFILESTDTIFSTHLLHHRPTAEWSDFFHSIFPVLQELKLDSPEIIFPKIATITNFLEGIYDCSFMRVEWGDNDKILVWNIFDYSPELEKWQKMQQGLNDIRLRYVY